MKVTNREFAHGMTRYEEDVMALWDDGVPIAKIAVAVNMKPDRVSTIVAMMASTKEEDRLARSAVEGSAALLEAIRAKHPQAAA